MTVIVNDARLIASIRSLQQYVRDDRLVMAAVGRHMREYVINTIMMGGRNRPYAPLSRWTRQRTGRTQPLISLTPNFYSASSAGTATVYFRAPSSGWSADMHHRGYVIPAREGRPVMRIPVGAEVAIFRRRARSGRVPAREIWPTKRETSAEVSRLIADWLRNGAQRLWR